MMEGEERKDGERRGSMATARRGSAVVRHLSARRSGSSSGFAISSGGGAAAELEGRMEGLNRQLAARDWVVEEDDAGRSVLVPASFSVKATPQERDERKRAVLKLLNAQKNFQVQKWAFGAARVGVKSALFAKTFMRDIIAPLSGLVALVWFATHDDQISMRGGSIAAFFCCYAGLFLLTVEFNAREALYYNFLKYDIITDFTDIKFYTDVRFYFVLLAAMAPLVVIGMSSYQRLKDAGAQGEGDCDDKGLLVPAAANFVTIVVYLLSVLKSEEGLVNLNRYTHINGGTVPNDLVVMDEEDLNMLLKKVGAAWKHVLANRAPVSDEELATKSCWTRFCHLLYTHCRCGRSAAGKGTRLDIAALIPFIHHHGVKRSRARNVLRGLEKDMRLLDAILGPDSSRSPRKSSGGEDSQDVEAAAVSVQVGPGGRRSTLNPLSGVDSALGGLAEDKTKMKQHMDIVGLEAQIELFDDDRLLVDVHPHDEIPAFSSFRFGQLGLRDAHGNVVPFKKGSDEYKAVQKEKELSVLQRMFIGLSFTALFAFEDEDEEQKQKWKEMSLPQKAKAIWKGGVATEE